MREPASWTVADTDQSIPARFESQARLRPGKPAVVGTAWEPTFAELDAAANRCAQVVLERSAASAGRVALLLEHDAPLFVAALGALKAGKTVVALNPGDPAARLARIRDAVEPDLVVVDERHRPLALRAGFPAGDLLAIPPHPDASPHAAPEVPISPDALAAVLYTSGSTGRPKGVMQTHRTTLHNVLRQTNWLGLRAEDRVVLLAALGGGQGALTAWSTLLNGATLGMFDASDRGVTGLAGWLADRRITALVASASLFRHFVRTLDAEVRLPDVRLVRLGSEPALRSDFEAFRRHFGDSCRFANALACSEAGIVAQWLATSEAEPPAGSLPVGRDAEGVEVLLMDEQGAEVAPGETGEIVVRGEYLSPGYWGDPALTAERFVGNAFHSGDFGRRAAGGALTVVGRRDTQVKVRGNRLELAEVEAALAGLPEVGAAAVAASSTDRGDTKLTAYVTGGRDGAPTPACLRQKLRAALPDHAVPNAFVLLDALPLTSHGKVDREALARIDVPRTSGRASAPGWTETEELLAGIWSRALELDRVSREDDFFELGGDSLTAAVVAAGVHAALGVELQLGAFAEAPTVAEMARLVDRLSFATGDDRPPLVRVPPADPPPMSFAQERMWRICRSDPAAAAAHTVAVDLRMRGPLDVDALRRGVDRLVERHEMLRTTFVQRDGRPVQLVHPPDPLELPVVDLHDSPDAAGAADALLRREAHLRFDLEDGPLLRLRLARTGEDEHRLIRIHHHIISDAWSWRIFLLELGAFYAAERRGVPAPLAADLPLQYGDYAAWERRCLQPAARRYRDEVGWWRRAAQDGPAPMTLPFARPSAVGDADPADGVSWFGLEPAVSRRLDAIGREVGATYFMLRLAVFAAVLSAESSQRDLIVGTYVTNRRTVETQAMFGSFSNLTTLWLRFARELTFRQWLARVRATVVETSARSEIPYEQLCDELRREGITPLEIRAIFGVSERLPPLRFAGLEISPGERVFEAMPWGFSFAVDRFYETSRCRVDFDARIHDPAGVRAFIAAFRRLAGEVGLEPDRPLRELLAPGAAVGQR